MTNCLFVIVIAVGLFSTSAPAQTPEPGRRPSSGHAPSEPQTGQTRTVLRGILFAGAYQLDASETQKLARELQSREFEGTDWLQEVEDRARYLWQDHGYFKAELTARARSLPDTPEGLRQFQVTITVLNEGAQYRLRAITFEKNRVVSSQEMLRTQFPPKDGDVFSVGAIGTGLERLRRAYSQLGYINFTAVPEQKVDDTQHLITLVIECEEGQPFVMGKIEFTGVSPELAAEFKSRFFLKTGNVYDSRLIELFFDQNAKLLPPGFAVEKNCEFRQNIGAASVDLTIHLDYGGASLPDLPPVSDES